MTAEQVEAALDLPARFSRVSTVDLLDTECFPCLHVCVLSALLQAACSSTPDAAGMLAAVERRRSAAFYSHITTRGYISSRRCRNFMRSTRRDFTAQRRI